MAVVDALGYPIAGLGVLIESAGIPFPGEASLLAGMSHMPFWRFQLFSMIGGLAWAAVLGAAGYFLGSNLPLIEALARAIGIGGLAVIVIVIIIAVMAQRSGSRQ